MRRKKLLMLLGSVCLSIMMALPVAVGCATPTPTSTPVKIGMIAPLTGVVATMGIGLRDGALVALDEINEAGGILDGRMVELVVYDNKGDPDESVAVCRKLIFDDRVSAIIGITDADKALAVAPICGENDTLLINDGMHWLMPPPGYRGVHQSSRAEVLVGATWKWMAENFGIKTVVGLQVGGAWGEGVYQALLMSNDRLEEPCTIYDNIIYEYGSPDVTVPVTKALSYEPDLIFSSAWGGSMVAKEAKLIRDSGFMERGGIYFIPGTGNDLYMLDDPGPAAMEGVWSCMTNQPSGYVSDNHSFSWDWPPEMMGKGIANPKMKAFLTEYLDRFGHMPVYDSMWGYDQLYLAAKTIDYVGSDSTTLDEYLEAIRLVDYVGLAGWNIRTHLTAQDSGTPNQVIYDWVYLTHFKDGKLRVVSACPAGEDLIALPEDYTPYLQRK